MKTLSYILLLTVVHGNIARIRRKEFTVQNAKTVMDNLIAQDQFDFKKEFSGDFSCSDKTFINCYKDIHTFYENKLSKEIFLMFKEKLTEKLTQYRIAVALLVSGNIDYDSTFVNAMHLKDSLMHCVIGVLSLHKDEDIKIDDLLDDYIFFSDLKLMINHNQNDYTLKQFVKNHFGGILYEEEVGNWWKQSYINYDTVKNRLSKLKKEINSYSSIFCELQSDLRLKWIKADTWIWDRMKDFFELNESTKESKFLLDISGLMVEFDTDILTRNKYTYFDSPLDLPLNEQDPKETDSTKNRADETDLTQNEDNAADESNAEEQSGSNTNDTDDSDHRVRKLIGILDWKLSDDDQVKRINNLPGVIKERSNNFTPIMMQSLNEYIKTRETNPNSMTVQRYYHTMSLAVDMIVSKVLFPRILHYGTRAMAIYYADMQHNENDAKEKRFFQQFYVGEQLLLFKHTLELFFTIDPFTFHKETVIDMLKILDFLIKSYMFHIQKKFQPTDPEESIKHILQYFNDIRFIQDSVRASKNIQSIEIKIWNDVYIAVNECVYLMMQLTEIKKPQ